MKFSRLAVIAASSLLILSACGSDSDDGGSSGEGQVSAEDIATALEYVGGEEGEADSSLEPFTIGFVNGQGGVPSFAEQEAAADAAVDFVNNNLGGVDGHPLELKKCFIQAEEDGQKCAAELLENDNIHIANVGVVVFGNETLYNLIDGKFPIISTSGSTDVDTITEDVYELDGGSLTNLNSMVANAEKVGKNIAIISSNNPAAKYLMTDIILPDMKERGMKATPVYVSDTATTPDYVSALQTSGAADADSIYLLPATVAGCVSLWDAMQQVSLTKPVFAPSQCGNDPMPETTGGGPEGWTLTGINDPVFLDSPQATVVSNVMDAAGAEDQKNLGFAAKGFGDLLTITKWAKEIGYDNLSADAFQQKITDFTGPAWMVPGKIKCGANTTHIGLCGDSASNYEYKDGKWNALEPYVLSE